VAVALFYQNLIGLRPTDRRPHHAPAPSVGQYRGPGSVGIEPTSELAAFFAQREVGPQRFIAGEQSFT